MFVAALVILSHVALCLSIEQIKVRRARRQAEVVIHDGLMAAMHAGLIDSLLAQPSLPESAYAMPPELWLTQRDPGYDTPQLLAEAGVVQPAEPADVRRSNAARIANSNIDPARVFSNSAVRGSVSVRGRILGRELITLRCVRCQRDLLQDLPAALVSGCTCARSAATLGLS